MSSIGNILWILLGGWLIFLIYVLGSILLMITIIGIPFGVQTLKMAQLALFPFSFEAVPGERAGGCLHLLFNILWVFIAGIEIACVHLILGILFAITLIGIPFAKQHFKLAVLGLIPFGQDIRSA